MLNQLLGYDKYNEISIVADAYNAIIVSDYDNVFYYGYDITTDKFAKISRAIAMPLPAYVIDLVRNEKSRVKFATKVCRKRKQGAMLLNINERTYYRLLNEYFSAADSKIKPIKQK